MKIELNLTNIAIISMANLLAELLKASVNTERKHRLIKSITCDLHSKFATKALKYYSASEEQKKRKITLKYHEAHTLEVMLRTYLQQTDNEYLKFILRTTADELNQKLA